MPGGFIGFQTEHSGSSIDLGLPTFFKPGCNADQNAVACQSIIETTYSNSDVLQSIGFRLINEINDQLIQIRSEKTGDVVDPKVFPEVFDTIATFIRDACIELLKYGYVMATSRRLRTTEGIQVHVPEVVPGREYNLVEDFKTNTFKPQFIGVRYRNKKFKYNISFLNKPHSNGVPRSDVMHSAPHVIASMRYSMNAQHVDSLNVRATMLVVNHPNASTDRVERLTQDRAHQSVNPLSERLQRAEQQLGKRLDKIYQSKSVSVQRSRVADASIDMSAFSHHSPDDGDKSFEIYSDLVENSKITAVPFSPGTREAIKFMEYHNACVLRCCGMSIMAAQQTGRAKLEEQVIAENKELRQRVLLYAGKICSSLNIQFRITSDYKEVEGEESSYKSLHQLTASIDSDNTPLDRMPLQDAIQLLDPQFVPEYIAKRCSIPIEKVSRVNPRPIQPAHAEALTDDAAELYTRTLLGIATHNNGKRVRQLGYGSDPEPPEKKARTEPAASGKGPPSTSKEGQEPKETAPARERGRSPQRRTRDRSPGPERGRHRRR